MSTKTWKELKAEGVKRCCVVFRNGKRCRARAEGREGWCKKHGPVMDAALKRFEVFE